MQDAPHRHRHRFYLRKEKSHTQPHRWLALYGHALAASSVRLAGSSAELATIGCDSVPSCNDLQVVYTSIHVLWTNLYHPITEAGTGQTYVSSLYIYLFPK